jgi:hypothetical protein
LAGTPRPARAQLDGRRLDVAALGWDSGRIVEELADYEALLARTFAPARQLAQVPTVRRR